MKATDYKSPGPIMLPVLAKADTLELRYWKARQINGSL